MFRKTTSESAIFGGGVDMSCGFCFPTLFWIFSRYFGLSRLHFGSRRF
nr:MAG TPA: hypothetical protein [Bacteriophage sp.]